MEQVLDNSRCLQIHGVCNYQIRYDCLLEEVEERKGFRSAGFESSVDHTKYPSNDKPKDIKDQLPPHA